MPSPDSGTGADLAVSRPVEGMGSRSDCPAYRDSRNQVAVTVAVTAGAEFRTRHFSSFERVAVVSDEDWARPALRMLSLVLPGKARAFPVRELEPAKDWLAAN